MENLWLLLTANAPLLMLITLGVALLLLIVFIITFAALRRTTKKYKLLVANVSGENLEKCILKNNKKLEQVLFEMNIFRERLEYMESLTHKCVQKVGLYRFDAFPDTGGKLSFALALLDHNDQGVVVSSIFGRDDARVYCKAVQQGKAKQQLSIEEEKAIRRALGFVE